MQHRSHYLRIVSVGVLSVTVLASSGMGTALQGVREKDTTREVVRQALDAGRYEEAERLTTDWCVRLETEQGPESVELARALDLRVEALLKNGKAGLPNALTFAEHAARIKEQALGPGHPDTAVSVHNLGLTHLQRGELTVALRLLEQGLTSRSAALGSDDLLLPTTRSNGARSFSWNLSRSEAEARRSQRS